MAPGLTPPRFQASPRPLGSRRATPVRVSVVHLVWAPLGRDPLRAFLASYSKHRAGVPHELVILFNGVPPGEDRDVLTAELAGTPHRLISTEAPLTDLAAYCFAARLLDAQRCWFMNSYSRILADDWLAHLDGALQRPDIAMAAATGSWASMLSYGLFQLRLPSAYRRVYKDRDGTLAQFEQLQGERTGSTPAGNRMRRRINTTLAVAPMLAGFTRFPAWHLRTNAFGIGRLRLLGMRTGPLTRKVHTHRLESGRDSLTSQVRRAGLRAVVVDRSGRVHDPAAWPSSHTFWQGEQDGLLIADNQTDYYAAGDAERRLLLARYAWGDRASLNRSICDDRRDATTAGPPCG